jgi:LacI family transcriptional regulator
VSIQDVAEAAGVSIATVSRVLNNPTLVSPRTATKVRDAINALGYVPNAFAQGLISKSSRVLGVVLPDIHGEFYSELLRGADSEARHQGYSLLVCSRLRSADGSLLPIAALGFVDGLALMITEPDEGLLRLLRTHATPTVVLDAEAEAGAGIDTVIVDNAAGAREATEHLLKHVPADRLCFVGGPRDNFDTKTRAAAFIDAIAASAGAPPDDARVAFGTYSFEWGRQWASDHAASLDRAGVLAGNDEIAYGVVHRAEELGLKAGRDFMLVGFDDTRLASLVRPMLSTVRVPLADVGAAAVSLLVKRIKDRGAPVSHVRLTPRLIVRETTRD